MNFPHEPLTGQLATITLFRDGAPKTVTSPILRPIELAAAFNVGPGPCRRSSFRASSR